jgi:hypothetical protein
MTTSKLGWGLLAVGSVGILVTLEGCSGYRVVQVHPGKDGIVALLGDRDAAREKATGYMNEQCPGGFDIVEEGEAVTGQTTNANSQSQGGQTIFGPAVNTNTQATTRNTTEWRIRYQCKGAAAAPGGGPAPAASGAQSKIHEIILRY